MGHKVRSNRKADSAGSGASRDPHTGRRPRPDGPRQGPQRDTGSFMVFPKELTLGPHVNVNHIHKRQILRTPGNVTIFRPTSPASRVWEAEDESQARVRRLTSVHTSPETGRETKAGST